MHRPLSFTQKGIGVWIFLAGILFTTGFAPLFLWPASIAAISLLFYWTRKATNIKQAALAGFLFGFGHQLTSLYWLPRAFYIDSHQQLGPVIYAGIPSLLTLSAFLAAFTALICATTHSVPKRLKPIIFISLWLGVELLRNLPPIQFPWNPAGAIFANNVTMMQPAYLGTVFLLSFITLSSGIFINYKFKGIILSVLILSLQTGYGTLRLKNAPNLHSQPKQFRVRIIQGNVPTAQKWEGSQRAKYLQKHINLTKNTPSNISIIIWPETATAYALAQDPIAREYIASALKPNQNLIVGFIRKERQKDKTYKYFNSMGLITPIGAITELYDKRIMVPFGESLPFQKLASRFLRTFSFNRAIYQSGKTPVHINLQRNIIAHPLICYEAAFPLYIYKNTINQTVLLNITNDSWFDKTTAPFQHFALARLRAVETGLPLIRAANTGISGVIDGYGRKIAIIPPNKTLATDVYIPSPIILP